MTEAYRGVVTQACECKRDGLWVQLPLEEMKNLIFSFHSVVEAERGVEFRHSTHNLEFGEEW